VIEKQQLLSNVRSEAEDKVKKVYEAHIILQKCPKMSEVKQKTKSKNKKKRIYVYEIN
jgi:hypothetical protein